MARKNAKGAEAFIDFLLGDDAALLQINEDRAVLMSAFEGPIIDPPTQSQLLVWSPPFGALAAVRCLCQHGLPT